MITLEFKEVWHVRQQSISLVAQNYSDMRHAGGDSQTAVVSTNALRNLAVGGVLASLLLGLLLGAGLSPVVSAARDSPQTDTPDGPFGQTNIDADSILMEATVDSNGDADWRVVYRLQLEDSESITGFEQLQADIENDTASYLDPFEERIQRTVQSARNATEREMSADRFSVRTERDSQPDAEFGLVVFEFEWDGFALIEDDGATIRAGDAIDRLFLEDGTNLRLRWPEEYRLQSQTPPTETRSEQRITWNGPLDFDRGEPRVVLTTEKTTPTDTGGEGTTTPGDNGTTTADGETTRTQGTDATQSPGGSGPDESDGDSSILLFGLIAVALVVAAAITVAVLRERETAAEESSGTTEAESEDKTGGPPPELLSNEERVLQLLEQEGGRTKQQNVAEQLDWTAAKTSQVVGDLRDEDQVEAFRLGRENVLTLPDVDLEDTTSSGTETDDDGE